MFKWLFKKKGCAKHMNNKLEVIGIDHGWSMMKTISQVFVTGRIQRSKMTAFIFSLLQQFQDGGGYRGIRGTASVRN